MGEMLVGQAKVKYEARSSEEAHNRGRKDASEKEPLDFKGRLEKLKNRCEHLC